jgi:hypothetical protein
MYTDSKNVFKNPKSQKLNSKKALKNQKSLTSDNLTVFLSNNKQTNKQNCSPPQKLEEGARSAPCLLVIKKKSFSNCPNLYLVY